MLTIKSLEASGIFRFENAKIEIPENCSLWMVLGENRDSAGASSNGAGKSSFFNVASWVITGNIPGKGRDIATIGGDGIGYGKVVLFDDQDDVELRIERRITKSSTKLYVFIDREELESSGDGVTKPQVKLNDLIGIPDSSKDSYEAFLNSVYLSFKDLEGFADPATTDSERVNLLTKYLGLDPLDTVLSDLRKEKNLVSKELDAIDDRINEQRSNLSVYNNISTKLKNAIVERNGLEKERSSLTSELSTLPEIEDILRKSNSIREKLSKLREREITELNPLRKRYDELIEEAELIDSYNSKLNSLTKDIGRSVNEIEKDITVCDSDVRSLVSDLAPLEYNLDSVNIKINDEEKRLSKPLSCPHCSQLLDFVDGILVEFNSDEANANLDKLKNEEKKLFIERVEIRRDLKRLKEERKPELENELNEELALQTAINDIKQSLKVAKNAASEAEKIDDQGYELAQKIKESRESLEKELLSYINDEKVKGQRDRIQLSIDEVSIKLINSEKTVAQLKEQNSTFNLIKDRLDELTGESNKLSKTIEPLVISISEIPKFRAHELVSAVGTIELYANQNLEMMGSSLRVNLSINSDGRKTELPLTMTDEDGIEKSFTSISSGEGDRIAIAIAFALRDLSQERGGFQLGFMFLDEVFDGVDDEGQECLIRFLSTRSDQYFIASHGGVSALLPYYIWLIRENSISTFKVAI